MNEQAVAREERPVGARIKVLGIGGGGGNAINNMVAAGLESAELWALNTDAQNLQANLAPSKIQLGRQVTRGLGAGGNPEIGRRAAEEDLDRIREALQDADMVFVTAGMGGGTGTGAAPVVARVAKEVGALTVAVVTKPFDFEGRYRMRQAEEGIRALREVVDTLLVIPNDRLLQLPGERNPLVGAFRKCDEVLVQAVRGIADLILSKGLINLDFADVRTIMSGSGLALIGWGEASGEDRALRAAQAAIENPLLEDVSIHGATRVLVNITFNSELELPEMYTALNYVREQAHPDVNLIFGVVLDERDKEHFRITVVATGFVEAATSSVDQEAAGVTHMEAAARPADMRASGASGRRIVPSGTRAARDRQRAGDDRPRIHRGWVDDFEEEPEVHRESDWRLSDPVSRPSGGVPPRDASDRPGTSVQDPLELPTIWRRDRR